MLMLWLILLAGSGSALALPNPTPTPTLVMRQAIATTATPSIPTGNFLTTQHVVIPGMTDGQITIPAKTIDIVIPTCVQTITPDANGYVPPGSCGAIWNYYPSFAAAVALAAIFGVLTAVHIWQAIRHKKKWCWVIIMASTWETLAFTFRALSSRFQQSSGIYLIFQIFILLAPLWVNAFAYMSLGRMIYLFVPSRSLLRVPAPVIAAAFVALDVVSFAVQLAGGSMAGPTSSAADQLNAIHIYMGGIGMQECFIALFVGLAMTFQREMAKLERAVGVPAAAAWRPLLWALYLSLGMITVRIIYRLVEFSSGSMDNAITAHEAYFYALEAVPMVIAIAVYNVVHPGAIIQGPGSEMPALVATVKATWARRSGKEVLSEGEEEQELTGVGGRV